MIVALASLLVKLFKIGMLLVSLKIASFAYANSELDLIFLTLLLFMVLTYILAQKIIVKTEASNENYYSTLQAPLAKKMRKSSKFLSNYASSVLVAVMLLIFFAFVKPFLILPWLIGIFFVHILKQQSNSEFGLVFSLMFASFYYAMTEPQPISQEIISFVILLLAFKYWFGETMRVHKGMSAFRENLDVFCDNIKS